MSIKVKIFLLQRRGRSIMIILIFAVGIEYDYFKWAKEDKGLEQRLRNEYPAAFLPRF